MAAVLRALRHGADIREERVESVEGVVEGHTDSSGDTIAYYYLVADKKFQVSGVAYPALIWACAIAVPHAKVEATGQHRATVIPCRTAPVSFGAAAPSGDRAVAGQQRHPSKAGDPMVEQQQQERSPGRATLAAHPLAGQLALYLLLIFNRCSTELC